MTITIQQFPIGNSPFIKMDAGELCPLGQEITSQERCQEANGWAISLGLKPKRNLQIGSWGDVPFQCSAQLGGDNSFHWSTNSKTDNKRFTTGEFVMICEQGKNILQFHLINRSRTIYLFCQRKVY